MAAQALDDLQECVLAGVNFGLDHLLRLNDRLLGRALNFFGLRPQRLGVLFELFLREEISDHEPQKRKWSESAFEKTAQLIGWKVCEVSPADRGGT